VGIVELGQPQGWVMVVMTAHASSVQVMVA
jgi:hypothetical protein